MDEQLRTILIIIVSVSIFGLLVFVYVKNYIRNKISQLVKEEKDKNIQPEKTPLTTNDQSVTQSLNPEHESDREESKVQKLQEI